MSMIVQGMDIYSNILYVKEAFAALSHLAQRAALTNKYRPETACIIGNYYSLKGQHEKVRLQAVHTGTMMRSCSVAGVSTAEGRFLMSGRDVLPTSTQAGPGVPVCLDVDGA